MLQKKKTSRIYVIMKIKYSFCRQIILQSKLCVFLYELGKYLVRPWEKEA